MGSNDDVDDDKRTLHMCELCGKRFPNEIKYKVHLKFMHSDDNVTCPTCYKVFKHPCSLQKHLNIHKGIKFTCNICGISVASKHILDSHIRRHNGEYTHKCTECGKEYYNSKSFNHHMEAEHAGIRYPCEICGSVLKSKRYYKDHMANHSNKDARTFECKVCHKYYSTKSALNGHMRIHTGQRYVCDICGKKSIQKGAHNGHMKMHSGEKSYICELCGKDFLRKDVLDHHMRKIHDSSKIPCMKCGEKFATEHQLMIHLHTHPDIEKPFPCQLCDEKFIYKNFLRNHVNRVHIESKDDLVKKMVKKKRSRKPEKKEKNYPCLECDIIFESATSLDYHREISHFEKKTLEDSEELKTDSQADSQPPEGYVVNSDDEYMDGFVYERIFTDSEGAPYANHEVVVEEFIY